MELIIILVIALLAAGLSLIPVGKKLAPAITNIGTLAIFLLSLRVAFVAIKSAEVVALKNWVACDSLGAIILLLVAFVGLTASIFSWGYVEKRVAVNNPYKIRRYYALYNLFLFSMLAIPMLSNIALVWIAVGLTTVSSVFLVAFDNTSESLEAAWKYIILTSMGAAFALLGVLILYWGLNTVGHGPFTWAELVKLSPGIPGDILKTAFIFILIGLGTKAGLVPFHTWLPDAYSQAPAPVCALLSIAESTTVLYVILRMQPILQGAAGNYAGVWFIVFGLISVGVAAFLIIQVKDLKRLFAFSTIEHMGIILVAAGIGGPAAWYAATLQIVSHALAKSFAFFATGSSLMATGNQDIASVRGLIRTSPVSAVSLAVAGLAIAGAPPFAVFLSEFSILKAGLTSGQYIASGLLAFFIVIAFWGVMYHINRMVFGRPEPGSKGIPLRASNITALLLAGAPIVLLGLFLPGPFNKLVHLASILLGR